MNDKKDDEMVSLKETSERLLDIFYELEESGGELTPELEAGLVRYTENRKVKAERIVQFSRRMNSQATALKIEAAELREMAAKKSRAADNLERYLLSEMQALGEKKIHTELFTIARARIGMPKINLLPGVEVEALPRKFIRVIPEERLLDKKAALAILKAGGKIPVEVGVFDVDQFQVHVSERLLVS